MKDQTQPRQRVDFRRRQSLRVLVVAPSFDILGGQSIQAARLILRLREVSALDVGFLPINPRLPGPFRHLQKIKYLRTILTSIAYIAFLVFRVPKYDAVHVFSASYLSFVIAPTPAILIAKLFGKRVLLNYHSGEAHDHFTRWPSAIRFVNLADKVVVPSQYLVRVFAKFGIEACAINNLIELDNFSFRARKPLLPRFLSNRNFETHYGVDKTLRAFAVIQKHFPDAQLTVAGDGSQRAELERLAGELGLRDTNFLGRVEPADIVVTYDRSDIFLNASEVDNQPLSILEAFACGLPVVTTGAGGIPDMVTDGESGFVVPCGDVAAIAERAIRLLKDPEAAAAMANRAHGECEKYSWSVLRNQWLDAYDSLRNVASTTEASRIKKLRRMSFDEFRSRSSQFLTTLFERTGWSNETTLPNDREFIKSFQSELGFTNSHNVHRHFTTRNAQYLFEGLTNRESTVNELRRGWPVTVREIVDRADRILDGKFDLLGFQNLSFGNPINWHLEPVSRKIAPQTHWSRIDFLDPEIAGDKKITWELNRHQYFITLGQAYWLTKDEKYAKCFVSYITSWIDENPPKIGINWASSLEIAFRSISWIWALHFFKESEAVNASVLAQMLKVLCRNARHLETYLSTYFSPNTHLTGEALGLYYLGTVLPEFKESESWRAKGRQILTEQLAKQVRADGVYFEQSTYYQRYTADFYSHFLILARLNNDPLDAVVETKLCALLDHLMFITRPDGTTPLIGDDDGGRLLPLDFRAANDFRAVLSTGAALFGRGDYKFVARELAEETLWLLGPASCAKFDQIDPVKPSVESKAFSDGGYFVLRDSWEPSANYLLFDCGMHGDGNCGHAHADALSIEVAVKGQTLIIDPGTHTYTGSRESRDWFRSSEAHNVLTVDSRSSSLPKGPFSWNSIAECELVESINGKRFDYVEGRQDGYMNLLEPADQSRSILFLKNDYWLIRDRVISDGQHRVDLRFHFAAGAEIEIDNDRPNSARILEADRQSFLEMLVCGSRNSWSREAGWISHCYGVRAEAPVCTFSANFNGNGELLTVLLPVSIESSQCVVREMETIGGQAAQIDVGNQTDLIAVRGASTEHVETVRLKSDFEWTWLRFSSTGSNAFEELQEVVVINGKQLVLDGKEILNSTKPLKYLVAIRTHAGFRLETEDGVLDLNLPVTDLESIFAELNSNVRN